MKLLLQGLDLSSAEPDLIHQQISYPQLLDMIKKNKDVAAKDLALNTVSDEL